MVLCWELGQDDSKRVRCGEERLRRFVKFKTGYGLEKLLRGRKGRDWKEREEQSMRNSSRSFGRDGARKLQRHSENNGRKTEQQRLGNDGTHPVQLKERLARVSHQHAAITAGGQKCRVVQRGIAQFDKTLRKRFPKETSKPRVIL